MNDLNLDLVGLKSVDEFHDRAATTFHFPAYYGRNRDAFWDCITDFVEPTAVRVCNFHTLDNTLRQALSAYIEMLRTYESESGGKFSVLIDTVPSPNSPAQDSRENTQT